MLEPPISNLNLLLRFTRRRLFLAEPFVLTMQRQFWTFHENVMADSSAAAPVSELYHDALHGLFLFPR